MPDLASDSMPLAVVSLRMVLNMRKILTITALMVACGLPCQAALLLEGLNITSTITFDSTVPDVNNGKFAGTGFQPNPAVGQLDSDSWASTGWSAGNLPFGGTQVTPNTDYARGSSAGGVTTGGFYAFDVGGGNTALGLQPGQIAGRDFAPGTLTLRLQNNTGATIDSLEIAYVIYVRNDTRRANSFNFSYSADDSTYTSVAALDYVSPLTADATPSWVANNRSTTISGLTLGDGGFFYLRWSGADAGGNGNVRDEFALDDISVTPVPEPAEWGLICTVGLPGSPATVVGGRGCRATSANSADETAWPSEPFRRIGAPVLTTISRGVSWPVTCFL